MVVRTYTAGLRGLHVYPVEVEVDGKQGIPQFLIIGLASKAVEEAKERITSAFHNCHVHVRKKRTVVNLAPAALPKHGTSFDLAIVVGLLKMYGELELNTEGIVFFGELSLDGQIKPIVGALPLVLGAIKLGFKMAVIPEGNLGEVASLTGIELYAIKHLYQLLAQPEVKQLQLPRVEHRPFTAKPNPKVTDPLIGQEHAKRAAMIAAAGGHHILYIGPPGAGKTVLAKTISHLLPPLSQKESIAATAVHSAAGLVTNGLLDARPFRSPHHSISRTALIGGGNPLKPGELSLAHHGVLFLDELLESPVSLLEMLRQPLEDRTISLSFAGTSAIFPAHITLVAATNPCACGYLGSIKKACTCSPQQIEKYTQKLSGPLLDRFDLIVPMETERQLFSESLDTRHTQTLAPDTERVATARATQQRRYKDLNCSVVSALSTLERQQLILLTPKAKQVLARISMQHNLSARRYWSMMKVAQTIADIEQKPTVSEVEVEEALQYQKMAQTIGAP